MNDVWNKRYDVDDFVYGLEANKFFQENIELTPKTRLLLPGEGEGRNALFAAKNNLYVHAFDLSEIAAGKAMHLAESAGVRYEYQVCSCKEFAAPELYYDAIGLIFLHIPSAERAEFHKKLINSLKSGGRVIAELFSKRQAEMNSGGPKNSDLLYSMEELKEDFKDMDFKILEEKTIDLKEGSLHEGSAWVIRLVAEKR